VASHAFQWFVGAIQFELGVFVMIEVPNLPVATVMATCALRTECAFMHVFLFVAGVTVRWRILELQA